jgi:hypothetical protein
MYERNCRWCDKPFITNNARKRYCTRDCAWEAEKKRNREYSRSKYKNTNKKRVENFISKHGQKAYDYLVDISKRQQIYEYTVFKKCAACDIMHKERKILSHHISYSPIEEVGLCTKCHNFLHVHLLKKKKCKINK